VQGLSKLDQVPHKLASLLPSQFVILLNTTNASRDAKGCPFLITAVRHALAARDLFPHSANFACLIDIAANLVAIEEVGSVNMITTPTSSIALLHCIGIADEVIEHRATTVLGNHGIQIIEDMLHS